MDVTNDAAQRARPQLACRAHAKSRRKVTPASLVSRRLDAGSFALLVNRHARRGGDAGREFLPRSNEGTKGQRFSHPRCLQPRGAAVFPRGRRRRAVFGNVIACAAPSAAGVTAADATSPVRSSPASRAAVVLEFRERFAQRTGSIHEATASERGKIPLPSLLRSFVVKIFVRRRRRDERGGARVARRPSGLRRLLSRATLHAKVPRNPVTAATRIRRSTRDPKREMNTAERPPPPARIRNATKRIDRGRWTRRSA
jgi:hypothetical protein